MATLDIQSSLPKQWVDAHQRGYEPEPRAEVVPSIALERMRQQLNARLYFEFGERRSSTAALSDAQFQKCLGLLDQLKQSEGRVSMMKDAEKLLYASGSIGFALTVYYGATIFFTSDMRKSIAESTDYPAGVLIPAALFVSGFFLLGRATSSEFDLKQQIWRECLGKKEEYGSGGGWVGQLRFEMLKLEIINSANIVSVLTAPSAPVHVRTVRSVKPRPEFSIRIPLPPAHPSHQVALTGAAALLAIGIAIMFAPVGI